MALAEQFGFGLRMASDLPVPGALPAEPGDTGPAVQIALEPGGAVPAPPGFTLAGDAIVYRHPCGTFRCEENRIAIDPDAQTSVQDLGEYLVANALPALLWQQGAFVLHAAGLRLPDGPTVAIAGPSGAGKSRLAALLVAAGAELIGDDSLALYPLEGGIWAKGLSGGWFARSQDGAQREFRRAAAGPARGEGLLDLLVVLGGDGGDAARLSPISAIEQVLLNRHRPQVPLLLGRQAAVLTQAATIARQLPIVRLAVEDVIALDPLAASAVFADLARSGSCVSPPCDTRN